MLLNAREDMTEVLLNFIIEYGGGSVFPRAKIQMLLTIAASLASCERSFSKLKQILSYLRAPIRQDRTIHLPILSIKKR